MKALAIPGVMALALGLGSCTAMQDDVPRYSELLTDLTGQSGKACVRVNDIEGYGVLEGDVISIDGGFNYYLATVLPGCVDLNTSFTAMFSDRFGEVCGRSIDRVYTGGDECIIDKMYQFDNREQAFHFYDLAQERRHGMLSLGDR